MLSLSARETPSAVESSSDILQSEIRYYLTLSPTFPGKRLPSLAESSASRIFDTFPDAFEQLGKRVLLLGVPGAGKTTTLLQFACAAAKERLVSPEKPLPIFAPVHRWDQKTPLPEWMQTLLPKVLGGVRLKAYSPLYLFDGLDELGGERLVDPAELEGETYNPLDPQAPLGEKYDPRLAFLKAVEEQLTSASVVISCREQDYQHTDPEVRRSAAGALVKIGDVAAVSALMEALQDENEYVRGSAIHALGAIGDVAALPALIDVLQNADADMRRYAADALGKLGDVAALPGLIAALQDRDSFVRGSAVYALGEIGDVTAIPALIEVLMDTGDSMRGGAAFALGNIGDVAAIPALTAALQDPDRDVFVCATFALEKLEMGREGR